MRWKTCTGLLRLDKRGAIVKNKTKKTKKQSHHLFQVLVIYLIINQLNLAWNWTSWYELGKSGQVIIHAIYLLSWKSTSEPVFSKHKQMDITLN